MEVIMGTLRVICCGDDATKDLEVLVNMMINKESTGQEITEYFNNRIHPINDFDSASDRYTMENFLCLAAIHDRIDVFEHNQPLQQIPFPIHDPLMVAVCQRNIPLIRILRDAGYEPGRSVFAGSSHVRCVELFNARTTAMDYVLMNDDVDVMSMFLVASATPEDIKGIICRTKSHQAGQCFLLILKKYKNSRLLDLDDVYIAATSFNVTVLEEMKVIGYDDFNRELCFQIDWGTLLHSAASEILPNAQRSSQTIHVLNYLISEGITAYSFNLQGKHPVDMIAGQLYYLNPTPESMNVDEYKQKCQNCASATRVLLSAMRKERSEQELLMPRSTAVLLNQQFYYMLSDRIQANTNQQRANLILDLCIQMLDMVLSSGVDLVNMEEEVRAAISHMHFRPFACAFSCFEHVWKLVMISMRNRHAPLQIYAEKIIKFNTLFLVYGMKPDSKCIRFLLWLLELNIPRLTTGLIHPFLSQMSSKDIEQFRQRAASMNCTSLISDKLCKSLQDTCRSFLYESVKDRRMAVHVSSLPLPKQMKQWLCFDYKIDEKNHAELGMRNVKPQKCEAAW